MTTFHQLILISLAALLAACNGEIIELTSEDFYDMIKAGAFAAMVDVRTPAEWETGHIANATFLDSLQDSDTADEISTTADLAGCDQCPIVVYCRSGARAKVALEKLELAGFQGPLYNGLGVSQWTAAGYELVNGTSIDPECKDAEGAESGVACKAAATATQDKPDGSVGVADDSNEATTSEPDATEAPSGATSLPRCFLSLSVVVGILLAQC